MKSGYPILVGYVFLLSVIFTIYRFVDVITPNDKAQVTVMNKNVQFKVKKESLASDIAWS